MAPWIFPGVLGFAGIAVLYWSLRRVFGLAASVAVSLYACLMFSTRAYDAPSNHPDYYSAMFSLMGTSLFLVALKQPGGTIRLSAQPADRCDEPRGLDRNGALPFASKTFATNALLEARGVFFVDVHSCGC